MAKLSTKTHSTTHRVIIYGAPKSGKTQLAGELAAYFKLIYVGMENGHETLFKLPIESQDNIELINLPDTRSYPIAIETALKMVKGAVSICEQHGKVSCMLCKKAQLDAEKANEVEPAGLTENFFANVNLPALGNDTVVVFDSLTQLSSSAISFITKSQPDDYKLNYDDWGNLSKLLDIFLSHLQQASYNVIVISHETEAETEGKKKTLVPVGGTRNYSRNVAKFFDHVIYAERKNKKHVFASDTTYATNIMTGSRTDVRMEDSENDSLPSLLRIFKPEMFSSTSTGSSSSKTATKATTSVKESTADILARLKKK